MLAIFLLAFSWNLSRKESNWDSSLSKWCTEVLTQSFCQEVRSVWLVCHLVSHQDIRNRDTLLSTPPSPHTDPRVGWFEHGLESLLWITHRLCPRLLVGVGKVQMVLFIHQSLLWSPVWKRKDQEPCCPFRVPVSYHQTLRHTLCVCVCVCVCDLYSYGKQPYFYLLLSDGPRRSAPYSCHHPGGLGLRHHIVPDWQHPIHCYYGESQYLPCDECPDFPCTQPGLTLPFRGSREWGLSICCTHGFKRQMWWILNSSLELRPYSCCG